MWLGEGVEMEKRGEGGNWKNKGKEKEKSGMEEYE
jgi:hypothetical protein